MSEENDTRERMDELQEKYDSLEMRERYNALRNDIRELKETYSEDRANAPTHTKYILQEYKRVIAIILALAIPAFFIVSPDITIPEWVYPILVGLFVGVLVAIPIANKVVEKLIKDRRKPIVEIDPEDLQDIHVHYVPQERVADIEFYGGERETINTTKGMGYVVEQFHQVEMNGKIELFAKATWEGEKNGLELKKDRMAISGMRETLTPLAKKGFAYKVMWPHIIQEMQSEIVNMVVREFEDIAIFKGNDLRGKLDSIEEKFAPDNITNAVDDEDIEKADDETLKDILNE